MPARRGVAEIEPVEARRSNLEARQATATFFPTVKGSSDHPSPGAIRLPARDLNRIDRHVLCRRYVPAGVHERDVARLDDLLDAELESRPAGREWSQLLPERFGPLPEFPFLIEEYCVRIVTG